MIKAWAALIASAALCACACAQAADDADLLTSRVDFTRPGARDLPIRCKAGDIEYFAGRTMGDVFGSAWPETPAATDVEPPAMLKRVAPMWPRGLAQTRAVTVVAVLIGSDGRALDARAICASTPAMAKPAVRAALRSVYTPAQFDGVPGITVGTAPYVFGIREKESTPVPDRPGSR